MRIKTLYYSGISAVAAGLIISEAATVLFPPEPDTADDDTTWKNSYTPSQEFAQAVWGKDGRKYALTIATPDGERIGIDDHAIDQVLSGLPAKKSESRQTLDTQPERRQTARLPTPGQDDTRDKPATVEDKIRQACRQVGFDEDIAIRVAMAESSLDPKAYNRHSGARGIFQFTTPTFKEYVFKHGDDAGFPGVANMVRLDKIPRDDGKLVFKYRLKEGIDMENFIKHSYNPRLNAALACRKMADEAERIHEKIGVTPSAADIYALHFFGPSAGITFLELYHQHNYRHHAPSDYFSDAAIARNRSIFFHRGGEGPERSIEQVMNVFRDKVGTQHARTSHDAPNTARKQPVPRNIPKPIWQLRDRQPG